MSFEDIKKQYYKLAAEYHPDINKAPDAGKQFLTIKEAFETIKKMHGKAVKMDFEGSSARDRSDFSSVRPGAHQYSEEFDNDEDFDRDDAQYKEWAYKASQNPEHSGFADSFETIHDIKDIKFRPDETPIPDASTRFHLDENKGKMIQFSSNSAFFLAVVLGCFGVIFYYINKGGSKQEEEQMENITYNLKNKDEYNQFSFNEDEEKVKQISMNMRTQKEYIKYKADVESKANFEKTLRNKFVPQPQAFVVQGQDGHL